MFELMIEIIKIFRKYPVNPLVQTVLEKVHKQYLVLFVLREQTRYFRKVSIVSVINSNLENDFCILPLKQNEKEFRGTKMQNPRVMELIYRVHDHHCKNIPYIVI